MTVRHLSTEELRARADRASAKVLSARPAKQTVATIVPDLAPEPEPTLTRDLESWWLPDPVREWVDAVALFCGVPKTMPIAAALCAAATVVQGKVSLELAPGIVQPLTLWWAVLARTGGRKSTVLKMAVKPIEDMEAAEAARIRPDAIEATNRRARLEQQIARMRRSTKAHVYTEGAQEHLQQLRELEHELSECVVPTAPRWIYDNINPHMLPQVLERNWESEDECARVAIWGEEGTFFANLLGRHSGTPMAETLNQGYSGSALHSTRKLEGTRQLIDIHIPEIFVSMCVFTQLHYRERLCNQELADNGFTGRLLLSEVDTGRRPELGSVPSPSKTVLDGYAAWLQRLASIPAGTVYRIGDTSRALLSAHMREVDDYAMAGGDGQGWALRSPERVAKLVALCGLDEAFCRAEYPCNVELLSQPKNQASHDRDQVSQPKTRLSQMSQVSLAPGRATEDILTKTLILSIYSAYLGPSRAQEPAPSSPARDARDIATAATAAGFRVGNVVTTRQLLRLKHGHWKRDRMLAAAHELVAMGLFEADVSPVQRGRVTLKEVFRIVRLSFDPQAPALSVVPDPEPELDEQPPDPDEYLGGDDFDPELEP